MDRPEHIDGLRPVETGVFRRREVRGGGPGVEDTETPEVIGKRRLVVVSVDSRPVPVLVRPLVSVGLEDDGLLEEVVLGRVRPLIEVEGFRGERAGWRT